MVTNKIYILFLVLILSFSKLSLAENAFNADGWKFITGAGTSELKVHYIPLLKKAKTFYKLSKGSIDSVVLSPDNKKIAFTVYPRVLASENLLYLINLNQPIPVLLGEFDLNVMYFSHDSKDLILSKYLSDSPSSSSVEIYRLNLNSMVKIFVGKIVNVSNFTSQGISKSGVEFLYVDLDDNVIIFNSEDKTSRNLNVKGYSPAWSPEGVNIAYQSKDGNCYILNSLNNEKQLLWNTNNYKGKIDLVWSPNGKYVLASRREGGAIRWISVDDNNKESVYYVIDIDSKSIKNIGTLK